MSTDEKYIRELEQEISLKTAKATLLLQEVSFLRNLLASAEQGKSREEIKAAIEHNPFDDFDFFGMKFGSKKH